MPRANRFYLPGVVWHITPRCHDRSFLLSFERDRGREALCTLTNQPDDGSLRAAHQHWVESSLSENVPQRESIWTESVAVGSTNVVADIKTLLGARACHRPIRHDDKETFRIEDST